MKVLYVDDNPEVRAQAESKIRSLGHRVATADSYESAIAQLREAEHKFQLVIADHMMAGQEGFDLILGLQHTFPEVQLIVLSSGMTRSEANQLNMAGIPYFQKPVMLESIVKGIRIPPPVRPKPTEVRPEGLLANDPATRSGFFSKLFGRS